MQSMLEGVVKPWGLIEGIADLVVAPDPHALAERMLGAALRMLRGRRAAMFLREQEQMRLYASRHLDQAVIDLVQWVWQARRDDLGDGRSFVASAPATGAVPVVRAVLEVAGGVAVVPVRSGEKQSLVGLLYLETPEPMSPDQIDLATQLASIGAVAAREPAASAPRADAGSPLEADVETATPDERSRDQLLRLLERNEWNLSRVARLLGITRPTIYKRLARYGLERKRVPKLAGRREPA